MEGYGYAIAGDTGGAIKGKRIDLHVPTSQRLIILAAVK
ncbi:3D domain-containing protein [Sporosarcina thermotolerans]